MAESQRVPDDVLRATHACFLRNGGSVRATAHELALSRRAIRHRLDLAQAQLGLEWGRPLVSGRIKALAQQRRSLPGAGQVKRYVLTSAQNNTHVHHAFLKNLAAFAAYHNAELLVSQFTYNKASYGRKAVKPGAEPTRDDVADLWYDDEISPYVCNDRVELAPSLVFCGEMNILPTAIRPLTGLETYTGTASGIFPHAKIALSSVASANGSAKFNYTTGTVTQRNYIQKKEGNKAEFHHAYGAAFVEVDSRGHWWVRQLNATEDGSFYDLDILVENGLISCQHRVEAINWGDVHVDVLEPAIRSLNWGEGGILDVLQPRYQFMHDTVDFRARNHHETKNPHETFRKWQQGRSNVRDEFVRVRDFLNKEAHRDWCKMVVVDSNHDNAMARWLREGDYRFDPENAVFFLESQLLYYRNIETPNFHLVEETLRSLGTRDDIQFLRDDESFLICGSIECGMHGHLGPNGARGNPSNLSRLGHKANTGHTHSAQILDGMYVAGTCSLLRLSYNNGPSSWSHSHVVTYPNGKRAILTVWHGQWRA